MFPSHAKNVTVLHEDKRGNCVVTDTDGRRLERGNVWRDYGVRRSGFCWSSRFPVLRSAVYLWQLYPFLGVSSSASSNQNFADVYIIVKKTSQFETVCKDDSGYITQLKQQKTKGDITLEHTDYVAMRC